VPGAPQKSAGRPPSAACRCRSSENGGDGRHCPPRTGRVVYVVRACGSMSTTPRVSAAGACVARGRRACGWPTLAPASHTLEGHGAGGGGGWDRIGSPASICRRLAPSATVVKIAQVSWVVGCARSGEVAHSSFQPPTGCRHLPVRRRQQCGRHHARPRPMVVGRALQCVEPSRMFQWLPPAVTDTAPPSP